MAIMPNIQVEKDGSGDFASLAAALAAADALPSGRLRISLGPGWVPMGTFNSYTAYVGAADVSLEDLTVENSRGTAGSSARPSPSTPTPTASPRRVARY